MNLDNKIKSRLNKAMEIDFLSISNDTNKHINHKNHDGGAHFKLEIVSSSFEGLSLLDQHKLVYKALNDMIKKEIHALALKTIPTSDWKKE
mgnify:FL=1|jgi:BolA protein|tara:strand:+ start:257 stop:529 length:273 start_codon:yes stop_codon:yes gene_type:complete